MYFPIIFSGNVFRSRKGLSCWICPLTNMEFVLHTWTERICYCVFQTCLDTRSNGSLESCTCSGINYQLISLSSFQSDLSLLYIKKKKKKRSQKLCYNPLLSQHRNRRLGLTGKRPTDYRSCLLRLVNLSFDGGFERKNSDLNRPISKD